MKLFAAIFLDGEINGSPLEGLDHACVAHELIDYFNTLVIKNRTHIISSDINFPHIIMHLQRYASIADTFYQAVVSDHKEQITAIATQILTELNTSKDIFFPGGWYANPAGHAIVYRLFYDKTNSLVFLAYNTGDGTEYHKKIDCGETPKFDVETYREKFNPVYAIRFDDAEKLKQPGELQNWIEKLLEPNILPQYAFDYQDNNAQSIYKKILPLSAYLNGKVVDPDEYFPWTTAGQKSGTCAQYSIQQAVRTFLQSDVQYEKFILDYRLHALNKFIDAQKLPKYFENHYNRAITNTARMITTGRMLEKTLTQGEKQKLLNELASIQKKAKAYFKALPGTLKPKIPSPSIKPQSLSIPNNNWSPPEIDASSSIQSDLVPCQSLLLFNPKDTFYEAVFSIQNTLELVDRRLFIYNLEQLCFNFCEQIKDFKSKPLETSQEDIETWAKVIQLLHLYCFKYFEFYFKDYCHSSDLKSYTSQWFKKEEHLNQDHTAIDDDDEEDSDNELSTIKPTRASKKKKSLYAASSPRNQMMWLALMTLQHYAVMQYHGALLDRRENWQATLSHLDSYTAYMQDWMVREKMQRDFFLSSTDPNLSHLFQSLNEYYRDYQHDFQTLRWNGTQLMGQILIRHYIKLMQTTYFKEEKEALEAFFQEHALSIRSDCKLKSDLERVLLQNGLMAIFMYENAWEMRKIKDIQWPKTPKLGQLLRMHYRTDLTIVLGTKALLYGSSANLGNPSFSIIDNRYGLWVFTALTGSGSDFNLLSVPYSDTTDNPTWSQAHYDYNLVYGINQVALESGEQSRFNCYPLFHDVVKKPYTSNEICLLSERAQSKIQRHLRTALPLQALQLLDYFTQHIHLLEERDYQFYLLFSLCQPGVIDQGLAHKADLLLAIQTLYQKGIALGDLSRDTSLLPFRGLFLIKITSWMLGYVLTSFPDKTDYRAYYETIDEDVRYWIAHTQPEPIKTELQRVLFYNTMKLYTPKTLSLPENRALLIDCLFSHFTSKEHKQDRVPGTITKTEDESFEPLVLNLLLLDQEAVKEALCEVLGKLLIDQSPFQLTISEATAKGTYTYINCRQQEICIRLLDGQIIVGENNLNHIPTFLRQQDTAYRAVMGSEYDPPAIRLNETTYQFEWREDTYCLSDKKLFKKMNDVWYQYLEDYFLPPVLQKSGQFVWVSEDKEHALIMQINAGHAVKQVGEFKENALHLLQPKGVFCLDSAERTHILQAFNAFEKPSMIAVVLSEDKPETHQFVLPYYGLSGHFSSETGMLIHYEQHDYTMISEETPFDTGIWLGNHPDTIKTELLYLVPIRPFYKQESYQSETITDVHYHLNHDVQRTLQDNLELEKKYAVFYFNAQGHLTANAYSTDELYLAYLYCGRYAFDKAYEIISHYIPQGNREELIYLQWLCEKLPAKASSSKQTAKESVFIPDQNAIVTPILLAIQLKALLLLRQLNRYQALKKGQSEETLYFLSNPRFIDFTIDVYNKYHRLSDHLSDDKKLPLHDLAMIASDIYLRIETMKQEEIKNLNKFLKDKKDLIPKITLQKELLSKIDITIKSLKKERFSVEQDEALKKAELLLAQYKKEDEHYTAKLVALDLKIKEQQECIQALVVKQHSGYLGLVNAKKPQLFQYASEPEMHYFFTQNTEKYCMHTIQPVWPVPQYEPTDRLYEVYKVRKVQGSLRDIDVKPEVIYISFSNTDYLSYAFLDKSGSKITNPFLSIDDSLIKNFILKSNEELLPEELCSIRFFVISDAIKSNKIESGIGTLETIQTLMASPERLDEYKAACNKLSLNIADDVLISYLKHFVCLALEKDETYLVEKNRLRTFCVETIIASEDLNEAMKKQTLIGLDPEVALDKRRARLSIAIVLLKALDYPKDFTQAYQSLVSDCTKYSEAKLKKRSLWSILSDEKHGFYKLKLQENTQNPSAPILSQAGVLVLRTHQIKKHLYKPTRSKLLHTADDSAIQTPKLKLYELPKSLVSISDILSQYHDAHQISRQRVIRSFEKMTDLEKRSNYDAVDKQLDELEKSYREQLLASITFTSSDLSLTSASISELASPKAHNIPQTSNIYDNMTAIKTMLAGLSAILIDLSIALKQYATFLPITLKDLLSTRVDQLSSKKAPIDLDRLLLQYALGIDEGYLTSRYVPPTMVPMIRRTLNDFLRQMFLYRQYQHILKALADINISTDPLEQAEKKLYFAERMLELAPLKASSALTLFQYKTNKTVRHAQWAMVDRLTQKSDSRNRAEQLMMGQGKTKVILPESIFLKANGSHLAMVLVPDALIQTEYQDLKYTAKTVYNQEIEWFQFDRYSPCDAASLRRYLSDFEDIILQRKGLVMAPGSLQSLYLKQRELFYQAQDYQPNSLEYLVVVEQLNILKDIVTLFKNKADVIADELHKVLDINIELNYSIGEKRSIEPELIDTALNLFNFIEFTSIAVEDETDILFILNGKSLSDILANPSMLYHPEALIDRLICYYESCYLKEHDLSLYSEKARNLLTAEWRVFLRTTIKSKADERYGRSLSEDVSIAIPYAGNNVPTTRLFENFVESMNYTIQITYLKGVPFAVFKHMMCAWKKSDQQDCLSPQSEAAKRYQECLDVLSIDEIAQLPLELKAMDVANEPTLREFYVHFQHNKKFILYALQENILPSIKIYPHKLTSNAIHLTHLVNRIQGVSGTLSSHPTFAKSIYFNQTTSFGVKNKIKDLLKKKGTIILTSGEKNDYQGISALIDIGAHERGKSNQQVAKELAENLLGSNMKYVLFFKEDHLAAWKVGGTDADIITDAVDIEKYLLKPEERFTYYAQTNATGTDILQAREARARVTVDVTTTCSDFLQAVMRMRQLFAGQTIEIVISHALKEKLGHAPTLDDLYNCLEQFEHEKLADDVFKSACKQLLDVAQNDFERRLLDMDPQRSIRLFPIFQSLLVGENLTVLPSHYVEEKTIEILLQIKQNVLDAFDHAMHFLGEDKFDLRYETHASVEKQCDSIIQQAMTFCREHQQTSLSLGTEVSIEQQQETQVQVELKIEQQTDPRAELLNARHPDLGWANILSVDEQCNLTGDDATHNRLAFIWGNSSHAAKIDWSDNLWLSTDFYMIHDRQTINTLPNDISQKPVLATLFWKSTDSDEVHALIVSQEEAEVLVKRLTASNLNPPTCQIWLETNGCHFALAGIRPENINENVSYQMLIEQISVLDGNVVLLALMKEWVWLKPYHIPILQQQMIKQEKQEDATLLVSLAKKIQGQVITQEETTERVSAGDFLPKPTLSKQQPEFTSQLKQISKIVLDEIPESVEVAEQSDDKSQSGPSFPESELHTPKDSIPSNPNIDYQSQRNRLNQIIIPLPKKSSVKQYGEKILKLTEKLNKNTHTGSIHDNLIKALYFTCEAIEYSQNDNFDQCTLAEKAQTCANQGAQIVTSSNSKISKGKELGGLLLGLAGVLLIAASIAFAVATHLCGTPIAIAGISLGASYIAAPIGVAGLVFGFIGFGLFFTRKPNEIQLQETLVKLTQETESQNNPKKSSSVHDKK